MRYPGVFTVVMVAVFFRALGQLIVWAEGCYFFFLRGPDSLFICLYVRRSHGSGVSKNKLC